MCEHLIFFFFLFPYLSHLFLLFLFFPCPSHALNNEGRRAGTLARPQARVGFPRARIVLRAQDITVTLLAPREQRRAWASSSLAYCSRLGLRLGLSQPPLPSPPPSASASVGVAPSCRVAELAGWRAGRAGAKVCPRGLPELAAKLGPAAQGGSRGICSADPLPKVRGKVTGAPTSRAGPNIRYKHKKKPLMGFLL